MLRLQEVLHLLKEKELFHEIIVDEQWQYHESAAYCFEEISYDSRKTSEKTLFFVKGASFKEAYLEKAVLENGLSFYLSETIFDVPATAIIVSNVRKAMSLLAMHFYGLPQTKLKTIAFTGTKGKTTTAYFTKSILDEETGAKCAMLSTMSSTLDGVHFFKSTLTTPESLDLFQMMAEAVQNKMTHFVMEVSSQAYKTHRVYGLTFDVGIFLNISPDHIGPIEHPHFEDYFYCKRQLLHHSKQIILNHDADSFELLLEESRSLGVPVFIYGSATVGTDLAFEEKNALDFSIVSGELNGLTALEGNYSIQLIGLFNKSNALAAAIASFLTGAGVAAIQSGLQKTKVPGRMEMLTQKNGAKVYVDYAHNKVSLAALLDVVRGAHGGKIIVVIGSTGNKAQSRRVDFGEVLSEKADVAVLTADDPNNEDPLVIAKEIKHAMPQSIPTYFEMDRERAIVLALSLTHNEEDAVVLAAKGCDAFQIVGGVRVFYAGDVAVATRLIEKEGA